MTQPLITRQVKSGSNRSRRNSDRRNLYVYLIANFPPNFSFWNFAAQIASKRLSHWHGGFFISHSPALTFKHSNGPGALDLYFRIDDFKYRPPIPTRPDQNEYDPTSYRNICLCSNSGTMRSFYRNGDKCSYRARVYGRLEFTNRLELEISSASNVDRPVCHCVYAEMFASWLLYFPSFRRAPSWFFGNDPHLFISPTFMPNW